MCVCGVDKRVQFMYQSVYCHFSSFFFLKKINESNGLYVIST